MQTVSEYLTQFFIKHNHTLEVNYPGLKPTRLIAEFCDFEGVSAQETFAWPDSLFFDFLKAARPLEYINQKSYFYRSSFFVDERVLIPRFETEILVEDSVNFINALKQKQVHIAEVGVGSFALGLSILQDTQKELHFWGGDISEEALEVAHINLELLKQKLSTDHFIELKRSDRLKEAKAQFDLIVSNPPYIRKQLDRQGVHGQTDKFEPHIALYLEDNIFEDWFEELFKQSSEKLLPTGILMLEGHEDSLLQLKEIALKYFTKVNLKNDYTGRLRFLHAYK